MAMRFIGYNLSLFLLLGGILYAQYRPANEADKKRVPAAIEINSEDEMISKNKVPKKKLKDEFKLDLACENKITSLKIPFEQVNFSIKLCKNAQGSSMSVTNQTNGFTATLFETAQGVFKTDFVPLVEDSILEIRYKNKLSGDWIIEKIKLVKAPVR